MTVVMNAEDKRLPRRIRPLSVPLAISIGIALLLGCDARPSRDLETNYYNEYMNNHQSLRYDQLDFMDTFEIWNRTDTCCDINSLLGFGKTYARNGSSVLPAGKSKYSVKIEGLPERTIDASISYINVKDGVVYYRDDDTLTLMSLDVGSKKARVLSEDSVGEVFVATDGIYYIQLDSGFLKHMSVDGSNEKVVYGHPIHSFVVCGGRILLLDNSMRLVLADVVENDDTRVLIASNVEQFFMNERIYIKSGNKVISCDPVGQEAQIVYESKKGNMKLCGLIDDKILIQEDGKLFACVGTNKEALFDTVHTAYESVSAANNETRYVVAINDKDGQSASMELLTF